MSRLSTLVDEQLIDALRDALAGGEFEGLDLKLAMEFLLSDGMVPASDLPVASLLKLEDWVRARARSPERAAPPA